MDCNLLVGEYIVDSSYIYQVTAIKKETNPKGREETWVCFKPAPNSDKLFTASIPVNNLTKAGIRKVLTPKEIKGIILDLKNLESKIGYDTLAIKEEVYQNNPQKITSILVSYWSGKENLGRADRELTEQILEHLCQEISLVTKKKYLGVRREITTILDQRKQIPLS